MSHQPRSAIAVGLALVAGPALLHGCRGHRVRALGRRTDPPPGGELLAGEGRPLATAKDLQAMMTGDRVGAPFNLTLVRQGQVPTVTAHPVELGE